MLGTEKVGFRGFHEIFRKGFISWVFMGTLDLKDLGDGRLMCILASVVMGVASNVYLNVDAFKLIGLNASWLS